ncbi:MAG: ATP-binding protein [Planctomycetota bacterium]|nr:ATP-binding protein [Planctomycetota bacterium]
MTFRLRILVAMLPLVALLLTLGGTGTLLIYRLGNRIDVILRENYASVSYMRDLNEALERIDSSFQFAVAGRDQESHKQYQTNWKLYDAALAQEQSNITVPGEAELVASLTTLSGQYRRQGEEFFDQAGSPLSRLYFGERNTPGLYHRFREIKAVSGEILRINQDNMEEANRQARRLAHSSLIWYGGGLAVGIALAAFLVASTIRTILNPIRAVTESVAAIGTGDLDQLVPVTSEDELGQLASAFNSMARQLRDYRRSHRAQLTRAQQTSQATINSFPDPVLVVDTLQHVELANPMARRLFGVLPAEAEEGTPLVWQPPDQLRQPLRDVLQDRREYLPEGFDNVIVLPLGEEPRSFLPRILPIHDADDATIGAAVLLEDVTRFRLLDEVKSNLVATVSHELKTPLTSIRLVLHLLLEETVGPLAPKQLELLVDARDNAERLLGMINNLLDLARLEQGRIQLQLRPERPLALLQPVADSFRPRAIDGGLELTLDVADELLPVSVDAEQFQHALLNLLDNALVHTLPGGRITLSARAADGRVVISVADTGSGIPAQYLPLVFDKYFRVPGDTSRGGSGLGLAIVREVITAHGGTVTCESQPGVRTVFRLELPLDNGGAAE